MLTPNLKSEIYGWQIERVMPDPKDETKDLRSIMIIAAHRSEQVWKYLAPDLDNPRVEVLLLRRFGPIVAILNDTTP